MSYRGHSLRAFRPSSLSDDSCEHVLRARARLENIKRYARLASRGQRLFEGQPGDWIVTSDDQETGGNATVPVAPSSS